MALKNPIHTFNIKNSFDGFSFLDINDKPCVDTNTGEILHNFDNQRKALNCLHKHRNNVRGGTKNIPRIEREIQSSGLPNEFSAEILGNAAFM
jgi:hypothetical protein